MSSFWPDRMITSVPAVSSWIRRVASMPSTPGICRSIRTTSGADLRRISTAVSPSVTTSITREVVLVVQRDLERFTE